MITSQVVDPLPAYYGGKFIHHNIIITTSSKNEQRCFIFVTTSMPNKHRTHPPTSKIHSGHVLLPLPRRRIIHGTSSTWWWRIISPQGRYFASSRLEALVVIIIGIIVRRRRGTSNCVTGNCTRCTVGSSNWWKQRGVHLFTSTYNPSTRSSDCISCARCRKISFKWVSSQESCWIGRADRSSERKLA